MARFEMKRINHQEAYSLDGACTNWAESYFSRLRRAEIGHHHHVAGAYLLRFAQEALGEKTTAACQMANRFTALPGWRWAASRAWTFQATGKGT